ADGEAGPAPRARPGPARGRAARPPARRAGRAAHGARERPQRLRSSPRPGEPEAARTPCGRCRTPRLLRALARLAALRRDDPGGQRPGRRAGDPRAAGRARPPRRPDPRTEREVPPPQPVPGDRDLHPAPGPPRHRRRGRLAATADLSPARAPSMSSPTTQPRRGTIRIPVPDPDRATTPPRADRAPPGGIVRVAPRRSPRPAARRDPVHRTANVAARP